MGTEQPADAPPRPDERPPRIAWISWIALGGAVAVALAAIASFPRSGGDAPPLASLALIGAVVTGVTTAALYVVVRRDLRIPTGLVASFVVAFALVGMVKFVLAPFGLYEVNAMRALDAFVGTVGDAGGAALTAAVVFGFYALVYTLVYRIARPTVRDRRRIGARTLVLVVVVLGVLVVSGMGLVALLLLTAPRQYLEFVFSSGAGILVAVALAGAAILIGAVFRTLARRPELIADVGAIVTLFSLGLGFLALYHALWFVYVLVLASIWPLRTVVPK